MYLVTHPRGRTRSRTVAATSSIPPVYHEIDWKLKKTGFRIFLPGANTRQAYCENQAKIMYLVTHPRGRTRSRTVAATGSIPLKYDEIDWKLKKTGVLIFLP